MFGVERKGKLGFSAQEFSGSKVGIMQRPQEGYHLKHASSSTGDVLAGEALHHTTHGKLDSLFHVAGLRGLWRAQGRVGM